MHLAHDFDCRLYVAKRCLDALILVLVLDRDMYDNSNDRRKRPLEFGSGALRGPQAFALENFRDRALADPQSVPRRILPPGH
jgi:hypothetical protein